MNDYYDEQDKNYIGILVMIWLLCIGCAGGIALGWLLATWIIDG